MLDGVRLILGDAGRGFGDVAVFIHGTTLATNAIIERTGARTALIATEGFRDILDIANESRYDQYDLTIEKPRAAGAARAALHRARAHGRARQGALAARRGGRARAVPAARAPQGIESVAVAFMHAYVNPAHERRVREILTAELPDLSVTLSSEVCPEMREYERTSTAVANAYVQPLMARYLERMQAALAAEKFRGTIYLMTSGGGLTAHRDGAALSRPAGGIGPGRRRDLCCADRGRAPARTRALSFDMGGTTAKICLIDDYKPQTARLFEVDRAARFLKGSGLPLRIPVIEMVEIGAGGGSIARVDALKRVTVGPESAGAEPGPACYGRGGTASGGDRCRSSCSARIDPERLRRRHASRSISTRPSGALRARRRPRASACRPRWRPTASTRWSSRTWRTPPACMRSSAARRSASTI